VLLLPKTDIFTGTTKRPDQTTCLSADFCGEEAMTRSTGLLHL
jgi:hypothetical protein